MVTLFYSLDKKFTHDFFFTEVIITTTPPPTTTPTTEPTLAPLDLVATAATHNTVSLVWSSVPLTDASTVMYIVEYQKRDSNEQWMVAVGSLKANKYTVHRLEPDTSYVFNVKAVDQNGVVLTQSSQQVFKKTHKKTVVVVGKLGLAFTFDAEKNRLVNFGSISSVGRALVSRAGGHDSITRVGPILRGLKELRSEDTSFAVQAHRSSCGSDDHIKWRSHLQLQTQKYCPELVLL